MEEEDTSNPGNVTANVGAKVGMLWIDVEGTQYWSSNTGNNVNFIQQMVDEGKCQGVSLGVYSSKFQWNTITGGTTKRSEEHTSELQSLMRIWYAVISLQKKKYHNTTPSIPY